REVRIASHVLRRQRAPADEHAIADVADRLKWLDAQRRSPFVGENSGVIVGAAPGGAVAGLQIQRAIGVREPDIVTIDQRVTEEQREALAFTRVEWLLAAGEILFAGVDRRARDGEVRRAAQHVELP